MPASLTDNQKSSLLSVSKDVLVTAIGAFNAYDSRTSDSVYSENSPADDFQREVERCTGPNGQWNDDFAKRLTERVLVYMAVSRNYLGSIYALVSEYPTGPGVAPITRCVAEAGGKIAWLLDNRIGPKAHARERVARLLLDESDDATRRKTIAAGLLHPDRARAGDEYREARNKIAKPGYFWGSEIDTSSNRTVVRGQSMPKTSQFIGIARDILMPHETTAQHVYGYLSALAHPTMFAYVESLAGGANELFCAKLVNYATLAFHNELRFHSGWTHVKDTPLPECDTIKEQHDRLNALIGEIDT